MIGADKEENTAMRRPRRAWTALCAARSTRRPRRWSARVNVR